MDLLQKFQTHWQQQFLQRLPADCHILLAVSGGVDSVVLVNLLHRLNHPFTIAHVNFQLRGEESTRDEQFVQSLGAQYGREVQVKQTDAKAYALEQGCSVQEAARKIRYDWFAELLTVLPAHVVATAHHADDNIETLLMYFFRGTGIQGITGMEAFQKKRKLIRPLLPFRKQELLAYAKANNLAYVEDSSNASDKYTRNFFRNQLIPQIREVYPQVEENLLHNIARFQEVSEIYEAAVQQQLHKLLEPKGAEWHIPVLKWKKAKPLHTLTWEIIRKYGFTAAQVPETIKLLDAANGSYISSATHRIIHNRNWMIVTPNETEIPQTILIDAEMGKIFFEKNILTLKPIHSPESVSNTPVTEALLDVAGIRYPLLLRKWKTGDYFYPLGMQKKKKLSRFLIDLKLSKTAKEKVWVLESDKRIVWVVGYRIDDRFKISKSTQTALHLSLLPA